MTEIYITNNHTMLVAGYGNPDMHLHAAAHILISLDGKFTSVIDGKIHKCKGIMIPGGVSHTVDSQENTILVFMLDQSQAVGSHIQTVIEIPDEIVSTILSEYGTLSRFEHKETKYLDFYKSTMCKLGFADIQQVKIDERIQKALQYIDQNIAHEITALNVSSAIFLSESWFSHLFREQMGISFAGYVVMRRIYITYFGVLNGKSITESAIDAGFSSSAHFAAANKKMFGITARDLSCNYKLYIVTAKEPKNTTEI